MKQRWAAIFLVVMGALLGIFVREFVHFAPAKAQSPGEQVSAQSESMLSPHEPQEIYNPEEAINVAVYEKTHRGVVNISTKSVRANLFRETAVEGTGSGSVIDTLGHILTNFHVVEGARDIAVTINGDSYPAELIGHDANNDIAVLKVAAPSSVLHPIELGDSSKLRVGQHILAIGNPFGLERTMSDGIISSLNRQITSRSRHTIKSIIQIDAALNQGNSGGPLLNSSAQIIGMNTAIATSTGDNAGIGFAIPVNTIRRVAVQLIQNGRVVRPTIGITRVYEAPDGLLIVQVTPEGPADNAGLKGAETVRRRNRLGIFESETLDSDLSTADLIVGIDGERVKSADDLLSAIETKRAGDKVILRVVREGTPRDAAVILGSDE
jgi:S1-C subfamily serine protease